MTLDLHVHDSISVDFTARQQYSTL